MSDQSASPFAEPDFTGIAGAEEAVDEDTEDELDDDELDDDTDDDPGDAEASEPERGNAGRPDGAGGTARAVLEHVARAIVDDPDQVSVDVATSRGGLKLSLRVAQSDMGRMIGRRGRTAQAVRTLVRAAAARDGEEASVDIVD